MKVLPVALVLTLLLPGLARADAIRLRSGDMLSGIIVETTDDFLVLMHPDLGRIPISFEVINTVHWARKDHAVGDGLPAGDPEPDDQAGDDEAPVSGWDEHLNREPWKLSLVLGGSITNNDEGLKSAINARIRVSRKTPHMSTTFSGSYLSKIENGTPTDNQANVIANQQWLLPDSPWFSFATGRYDFDEFRSWIHRIQIHGGPGYDFYKDEDFRFFGVGGIGGRKDIGSIDEPAELEAQVGLGIAWTLTDRQTLAVSLDYYPELTGGSYRFVNITDWTLLIDSKARLSFNIHLNYEYSTDPDPGFPNDNYALTWGLQWDF